MYSLVEDTYFYKIIIHTKEKGAIMGKCRQKSEGKMFSNEEYIMCNGPIGAVSAQYIPGC